MNPYEDITAIPDSIGERTKYRNFRKDVTRILAKTICEYIDDFGAVLRNDINDCFLEEINSLQEKNIPKQDPLSLLDQLFHHRLNLIV